MDPKPRRVCPAERSGGLDCFFRRLLQNPKRILEPFVEPGMRAMDFGCGPGFFTLEMARLVGPSGRVIAVDLQEDMLAKVAAKKRETNLAQRIHLHRCDDNHIGLLEQVDFVLAFYAVHEVPDRKRFFSEVRSILRAGGTLLLVEPPVHVSSTAFKAILHEARDVGFEIHKGPPVLLSKTAILKR
jgi:ubiquinone/menaquinone biosynthesis C-methylase UbiE